MSENTFSQHSDNYAQARPRYPKELYQWIASQCLRHESAWDCATGNGQAAVDLAAYFQWVSATDVSKQQIDHHLQAPGVTFSVQPAERTTFADGSFDLITVAQALHWFDYEKFWAEVRRVARPGAFFCAWGYDWFSTGTALDEAVLVPFRHAIEPFWAANNRILWDGYQAADIAWPFQREAVPALAIQMRWTTRQIVEYMKTWSAYKRGLADPVVAQRLAELERKAVQFGGEGEVLDVRMPLTIVAGRAT